ncbi:MAG: hypothetical protein ACRD1T_18670, partial [Acidimicrobiia bacterium]
NEGCVQMRKSSAPIARLLSVLSMAFAMSLGAVAAQASVQRSPEHLALLLLNTPAGYEQVVDKPGEVGYFTRTQAAAFFEVSESELEAGGLLDGFVRASVASDGSRGRGTVVWQLTDAAAADAMMKSYRATGRDIESTFDTPEIPDSFGYIPILENLKGKSVVFRKANLVFDVGVVANDVPSNEEVLALAGEQRNALGSVADEAPEQGLNISYLVGMAVIPLLIAIAVIWGIVKLVQRSRKPAPALMGMGYSGPQPFMPANGAPTPSYQPNSWEQPQPQYQHQPQPQYQAPSQAAQYQPAAPPGYEPRYHAPDPVQPQPVPVYQPAPVQPQPQTQPMQPAYQPAQPAPSVVVPEPVQLVATHAQVPAAVESKEETVGVAHPVVTYPDGWEGPRE